MNNFSAMPTEEVNESANNVWACNNNASIMWQHMVCSHERLEAFRNKEAKILAQLNGNNGHDKTVQLCQEWEWVREYIRQEEAQVELDNAEALMWEKRAKMFY